MPFYELPTPPRPTGTYSFGRGTNKMRVRERCCGSGQDQDG